MYSTHLEIITLRRCFPGLVSSVVLFSTLPITEKFFSLLFEVLLIL